MKVDGQAPANGDAHAEDARGGKWAKSEDDARKGKGRTTGPSPGWNGGSQRGHSRSSRETGRDGRWQGGDWRRANSDEGEVQRQLQTLQGSDVLCQVPISGHDLVSVEGRPTAQPQSHSELEDPRGSPGMPES